MSKREVLLEFGTKKINPLLISRIGKRYGRRYTKDNRITRYNHLVTRKIKDPNTPYFKKIMLKWFGYKNEFLLMDW